MMDQKTLQIFIITVGRAEKLESTLEQIRQCDLAQCDITLLDNNSPDATPQLAEKYKSLFPQFTHVRRPVNVGYCMNYFDALYRARLGNFRYAWVLCDDDTINTIAVPDFLDTLKQNLWDVIFAGAPGISYSFWGYEGSIQQAVSQGLRYYFISTFVPGLIFRPQLITDQTISASHILWPFSWPQILFVHSFLQKDLLLKILGVPVIFRKGKQPPWPFLYSWCRCTASIPEEEWRRLAVRDFLPTHFSIRALECFTNDWQCGELRRVDLLELIFHILPRQEILLRIGLAWLLLQPRWVLQMKNNFFNLIRKLSPGFWSPPAGARKE